MRYLPLITPGFCLWLIVATGPVAAQTVDFSVGTSSGSDTLVVGAPVTIFWDINTNGAEVGAVGQTMAFTFTNGNMIGAVQEVPSTTSAEFSFSPAVLAVMEIRVFTGGDHFTGAPLDSLQWVGLSLFPPGLTGAGEFAHVTFTPLDTGTIVIDTATAISVADMFNTTLPHTWTGPHTIHVVDPAVPKVEFTVRTSSGSDVLILGEPGTLFFDINTNGLELGMVEQDMAFDFTNGNIIGVVEQAPSTTTAEFSFSPFTLAAMELPAFADGDHFTGAPLDSLRWGAANLFLPGLTGAGEFARLTFVPLDTGTIVLDTFRIMTAQDLYGIPQSHIWSGPYTIHVVDTALPRVEFTVRTSTGNDTLIAGTQGAIIFDVHTHGVEVRDVEQDMGFTFTNGNLVGVIERAPSSTSAEFAFSPFTLAALELSAFTFGDHFTGAPLDSLRWGAADMFGSGLVGAGEFARLTFVPSDTGTIVVDTFRVIVVHNMSAITWPHTWAGPRAIHVIRVCPVELTGDVNTDGVYTAADIIGMVNYVFKSGAEPLPCPAAADVNCDGAVTAADIIRMVNFVFKSGPAPCDICTLIPGTWTCP